MATAQAIKEETVTTTASLNVVRHTIRTAVSSILYLRNIYEEAAFSDRSVAGLPLKILNGSNANEAAKYVFDWLENGVFQALSDGYLKLMILGIHGEDDSLLEAYHFGVTPEGATLEVDSQQTARRTIRTFTKAEVRSQTSALLRNLIEITQELPSLPNVRYISTKLWYNETAPRDYLPSGFRVPTEEEDMRFEHIPKEAEIGKMNTGHHCMTIRLKTLAAGHVEPSDIDDQISSTQINELRRAEIFYSQDNSLVTQGFSQALEEPLPPSQKPTPTRPGAVQKVPAAKASAGSRKANVKRTVAASPVPAKRAAGARAARSRKTSA